jgi:hypothetical protein
MVLTEQMIEAGEQLIRKLDECKRRPDAALWFYDSDWQRWRLVIADSEVGTKGPKAGYRAIQKLLLKFPEIKLEFNDVTLVTPYTDSVPIPQGPVRSGNKLTRIHLTHSVVDGTVVEEALVYRLIPKALRRRPALRAAKGT